MKYRAEIDGLRALAVVPVILFHAGFELFSGGFVGVDVFFVISGYLITTILIEDIENQRFSLVNFYERRARRILASTFLCNACMHSVCLDVDAAKSNERLFAKSCCCQSICIKYLILARKWLLSMQLQKKSLCYIRGA